MIGRLVGQLIEKNLPSILLDVNGVGYELSVPMTTGFNLPEVDEAVTLFTHLVVREDAHHLYGFSDRQNRELFRELLKVNGIGAKMALAILSSLDYDTLSRCVFDNDVAMLTQVPGIGKKTAERLLLDLGDRLANLEGGSNASRVVSIEAPNSEASVKQDAISALTALGYKPVDSKKMVESVYAESLSSEELIKLALQGLMRA